MLPLKLKFWFPLKGASPKPVPTTIPALPPNPAENSDQPLNEYAPVKLKLKPKIGSSKLPLTNAASTYVGTDTKRARSRSLLR